MFAHSVLTIIRRALDKIRKKGPGSASEGRSYQPVHVGVWPKAAIDSSGLLSKEQSKNPADQALGSTSNRVAR